MKAPMKAISAIDIAPVPAGATPAEALRRALDLARHAEEWGYRRFWLTEHHNMIGIASAATSVVIGYVAGGTRTIRVGAGGIMLPNHAPLVIAEQFGTLETLYPGRLDLGLGRAAGTDQGTLRALRRSPMSGDTFPQDVLELQAFLAPVREGQLIQAVPGSGLEVPLWILGSSLFGAQLAAELGLPFAFASHFLPQALMPALAVYRAHFKPSRQLDRPYTMAGSNVIAAETDDQARVLFTSVQQAMANILRGKPGPLPEPIDDIGRYWTAEEKAQADERFACSFVGSPDTVRRGLEDFIERTGVDEIIIAAAVHDHAARLRSYEIVADVMRPNVLT
jgi:luciferase family oxidoreductase group 1